MTRKQRRILFAWAFVFFILLSAVVLSLAFGFRYDFEHNRLVKTGSIVLKPNTEAQIFIDGKLEGETSFLKGTFFKKRLLPGIYLVSIKKEKFSPWEKEVEVKEGLVSNLSRVVLFNEGQVERGVITRPDPLSLSREAKKMAYWEKDTLAFYDFAGNLVYNTKPIPLNMASLKIIWEGDGKAALAYDKSKAVYFDLAKKTFRDLGSPAAYFLETAVLKDGRLYFLRPSSKARSKDLFLLSLENLKGRVVSQNIASFFIAGNGNLLAASGSPYRLLKMDLDGKNEQILGNLNATGKINNALVFNGVAFILIGSDLYSFKEDKLDLISKEIKSMAVSLDESMLSWHTNRELWVEWVKNSEYPPFNKAGEKILVFKSPKNIESSVWYKNNNYIFLETESGLTVVEVDSEGIPNKYNLLSLSLQEEAWYDLSQNKIFKVSNSSGLAAMDVP
ncbi:MAG: hypothetical protein A3C71_01700 [Candidatus Yanofskybacteria bacterium RIFCSPHIGHO2_02_FULL_43_15c]|uniref:PEGA domain-containing protein n=1 Tax=Candidatus Yanofskybacteria bacterium RIFCSPHIGHO2_02_FULL_43_15c TaxID=1802679 RepID=A0A1F8FH50_9BACT|nr:MAG: hypothetical protein A3C71_01700 [Candidatus Yanofskybacteria bacterium RIFCSPHIGHO2_02_FULL_43_15c]